MNAIPRSLVPILICLRPHGVHLRRRMSARQRNRKSSAFGNRTLNNRKRFFQCSAAQRHQVWKYARIELHKLLGLSDSRLFFVNHNPKTRQLAAQLHQILKKDRLDSQFARAFKIQSAVIDQNAFRRVLLSNFQRQTINFRVGLPNTQIARAEKSFKIISQLEFLNTIFVDLARFVVERCHQKAARMGNSAQKRERLWICLRLIEHESLEIRRCEFLFAVKNRAMKVLIQSSAACFKSVKHQLVALLNIWPVEMKLITGRLPRRPSPAVRQDHTAIVPKESFDIRHRVLSPYCEVPCRIPKAVLLSLFRRHCRSKILT